MDVCQLFRYCPWRSGTHILHRYEFGPTMLLCSILQLLELIGPHGACTNVSDLAGLDEIVQSFHSLLWLHSWVVAVDLEQVDVVGVQALQACIHGIEDGLSRKATLVDVVFRVLQLWIPEMSILVAALQQ